MRKVAILIALGALFMVAGGLLLTESGRSAGRAALLVAGLFSHEGKTPLSLLTSQPTVSDITIATQDGDIMARLYEPVGDGRFGALILVAGYPSNIEDLQLSTLAADLARMGIVTLIPRLPALSQGYLSPEDVSALVGSYEWLERRPNVAPDYIGYAGFCVGSSLALLAAEDARINERVRLVNVFGGYFDLATLLHSVATRSYINQGRRFSWRPSESTLLLVTQNAMSRLTPIEREALEQHFEAGANANVLPATLSPGGLLIAALVYSADPVETDRLLAQLPLDHRDYLAALSPNHNINSLKARLFIMHDESDPYIPVSESYRLADSISDPGRVNRAVFELFAHVRPRQTIDRFILVRDGLKLISYLDDLLGTIMPSP